LSNNGQVAAEPLLPSDPKAVLRLTLTNPLPNVKIRGSEVRITSILSAQGTAANATTAEVATFITRQRLGVCIRVDNDTQCAPISDDCCVVGRIPGGPHLLSVWVVSFAANGTALSAATERAFETVPDRRQTGGLPYGSAKASFPSTKVRVYCRHYSIRESTIVRVYCRHYSICESTIHISVRACSECRTQHQPSSTPPPPIRPSISRGSLRPVEQAPEYQHIAESILTCG
jgi:hypothetical protein